MVPPTQIGKGDVIEDAVGHRWLRVQDIRLLTDADNGAFSFFGDGPDDRITFEGNELVKRRTQ